LDWAFTALAVNRQATNSMSDLAGNTEGSRTDRLLQAEELFSPLAVSILMTFIRVLLRLSLTVNIDTVGPWDSARVVSPRGARWNVHTSIVLTRLFWVLATLARGQSGLLGLLKDLRSI
jgi:hypothetical protein